MPTDGDRTDHIIDRIYERPSLDHYSENYINFYRIIDSITEPSNFHGYEMPGNDKKPIMPMIMYLVTKEIYGIKLNNFHKTIVDSFAMPSDMDWMIPLLERHRIGNTDGIIFSIIDMGLIDRLREWQGNTIMYANKNTHRVLIHALTTAFLDGRYDYVDAITRLMIDLKYTIYGKKICRFFEMTSSASLRLAFIQHVILYILPTSHAAAIMLDLFDKYTNEAMIIAEYVNAMIGTIPPNDGVIVSHIHPIGFYDIYNTWTDRSEVKQINVRMYKCSLFSEEFVLMVANKYPRMINYIQFSHGYDIYNTTMKTNRLKKICIFPRVLRFLEDRDVVNITDISRLFNEPHKIIKDRLTDVMIHYR